MIYFLLYLFLEVYTTTLFSSEFGGVWLFVEIVGSAVVGVFIIANFKYSMMDSLYSLYRQEITQQEFVSSSIFSLVGAVMLIIPGVLTDILGILMQFESLAIIMARPFIKRANIHTNARTDFQSNTPKKDDDIIDVEVIEKK
jgi:UPF0716 family protein affecting phage T7 exclusion